jgi:hypothetical protein
VITRLLAGLFDGNKLRENRAFDNGGIGSCSAVFAQKEAMFYKKLTILLFFLRKTRKNAGLFQGGEF